MTMALSVVGAMVMDRVAGLLAVEGKGMFVWTLPALPAMVVLVAMAVLLVAPAAQAGAPAGYTLSWSDEFNQGAGSKPSSGRWTYDLGAGGWGNAEWQTYVNDVQHAQVIADTEATDGKALQIQATREAADRYTSARIKTQGKASFQYGYMEARIRMPYGQGIWPAFWMLGTDFASAGWPACGEIDIMENIGKEPGIVHGTLHGPGYSGGDGLASAYTLPNGGAFKDAYHTFAVRWREDAITFYVDGAAYSTRKAGDVPSGAKWVFNKPFFFIINLAVGGRWPGYPDGSTVFPQNYRVDYVRVYKLLPPVGKTVTLKSLANGKYVTAGSDGESALIASQPGATLSERFTVMDAGNGMVALKSVTNSRYVSAADGAPLKATASSIGSSERFLWVDAGVNAGADAGAGAGNVYVALKSQATGRYVCAESGGAAALIADRPAVGTWESFAVTPVDTAALASDVASALSAAAGLNAPGPVDAARLDVETGGTSPGVELADAARLARRAAGLDPL